MAAPKKPGRLARPLKKKKYNASEVYNVNPDEQTEKKEEKEKEAPTYTYSRINDPIIEEPVASTQAPVGGEAPTD